METVELNFNDVRVWTIRPAPTVYRIARNGVPIEIHSYIPNGGHNKQFMQTSMFVRPRFAWILATKLNKLSGTSEYSVVCTDEYVTMDEPCEITEYYHPQMYTARDILGE